MRFIPVRLLVYTIAMAAPAVAQPPAPMSSEMSHVEVSIGADAMFAGPGIDLERQMVQLGLQSRDGRYEYPLTENPSIVPGVFAQVNVGVTQHAMVGFYIGADESTTTGRFPEGGAASVRANIKTRALLASFRPTPWVKVAAGPALVHRLLEMQNDGRTVGADARGWMALTDVKFVRRPMSPEHPPVFGYVTAQYRGVPALELPSTVVTVNGRSRQLVPWPAERVRMSHWTIGVGVGFEI